MARIQLIASEGKVLKKQGEVPQYGLRVNCIEEQASQWAEVPFEEYEEYKRSQEQLNEEEI